MKRKTVQMTLGVGAALAIVVVAAAISAQDSTPSKCRMGSRSPSSRDTKADRSFPS